MFDKREKVKHREKINKLVTKRVNETGKDEKSVRIEINKELRNKRKQARVSSNQDEVEKIRINIKNSMVGKDEKAIEKATNRAIDKYYKINKKNKQPTEIMKKQANELLLKVNGQLWCPDDQMWWDDECKKHFEELELLAAMNDINLLKAPQNFEKIYPDICKNYFDLLAKKRFSHTEISDETPKNSQKTPKSSLIRKFEEKKAKNNGFNIKDQDILKEVVQDVLKRENEARLKTLKKNWYPTHKPFFDNECKVAYEKLAELAKENGFELGLKCRDFKKLRIKNKDKCDEYIKLLKMKKIEYNNKQKAKLGSKENKVETETKRDGKIETDVDLDKTIAEAEREIKKERRKQAKLAKKMKNKLLKEESKAEKEK